MIKSWQLLLNKSLAIFNTREMESGRLTYFKLLCHVAGLDHEYQRLVWPCLHGMDMQQLVHRLCEKQYAREISETIDIQMDSSRRVRVSAKSPPMKKETKHGKESNETSDSNPLHIIVADHLI